MNELTICPQPMFTFMHAGEYSCSHSSPCARNGSMAPLVITVNYGDGSGQQVSGMETPGTDYSGCTGVEERGAPGCVEPHLPAAWHLLGQCHW